MKNRWVAKLHKITKIKSLINDEKGSAIVEATLILPLTLLVILSVLVLYTLISQYIFDEINKNSYFISEIKKITNTGMYEGVSREYKYTEKNFNLSSALLDIENKALWSGFFQKSNTSSRGRRRYKNREKNLIYYKKILE